jgi:hypothetical protein
MTFLGSKIEKEARSPPPLYPSFLPHGMSNRRRRKQHSSLPLLYVLAKKKEKIWRKKLLTLEERTDPSGLWKPFRSTLSGVG